LFVEVTGGRVGEKNRGLAGDQDARGIGVPAEHALARRVARQVDLALPEIE
jgi:hypothetical protein